MTPRPLDSPAKQPDGGFKNASERHLLRVGINPKMNVRFPFQVETTRPSTAEREGRKWPFDSIATMRWRLGRTWIFTDGGGGGRFAAAIVRPGVEEHRITGCREPLANSVVAELDGVILGLENTVLLRTANIKECFKVQVVHT